MSFAVNFAAEASRMVLMSADEVVSCGLSAATAPFR